jgi:hypothetical protein
MGTGVGEAMLISAATGGGMAAVTGGDPLKGALLGAVTGGVGHGIAGATAVGGANVGTQVATTGAEQMVAQTAADQAAQTAANVGMQGVTPDAIARVTPPVQNLTAQAASPDMISSVSDLQAMQNLAGYTPNPTEMTKLAQAAENPMFPKIAEMSKSSYFYPGLGAMGSAVGGALTPQTDMPGGSKYSGPLSRFRYDPEKYKRQMATGGLANTAPAQRMMQGSQLGSYSDGGQLLSGPGNGMSDDIPASIGGKQPARLADGEFVIPADVVSGIGNGSTGAGADELYKLLDRVRLARTGSDKQGREISPMKYLPT